MSHNKSSINFCDIKLYVILEKNNIAYARKFAIYFITYVLYAQVSHW